MSRVVLALGGNALLRRGEPLDAETQERNLAHASDVIARMAVGHEVVLVHGSGPQVGMLAKRAETSPSGLMEPLDVVSAEIEGMMGYLLQRELRSRMTNQSVVTLLTQIAVDPDDPAFARPTKPIGPMYDRSRAEALAAERGWTVGPDGDGWRRLVPSPAPKHVLELNAIRDLLGQGHMVVCAGGGGVPVVEGDDGRLRGVEAVVDKDHSAALLAIDLDADLLVLLTDAEAVYRDWPERNDPIRELRTADAEGLDLDVGSMGPKAEAALRFAQVTGHTAVIGSMEDGEALLEGSAGTRVIAD